MVSNLYLNLVTYYYFFFKEKFGYLFGFGKLHYFTLLHKVVLSLRKKGSSYGIKELISYYNYLEQKYYAEHTVDLSNFKLIFNVPLAVFFVSFCFVNFDEKEIHYTPCDF